MIFVVVSWELPKERVNVPEDEADEMDAGTMLDTTLETLERSTVR